MRVGRVALGAARGGGAVADVAVAGAEAGGMLLMQFAARPAPEAGVTLCTVGELWRQWFTAWGAGDVAELAVEAGFRVMEDVS